MKSEHWDEMDDAALRQLEAEMGADLRDVREAATVYAERAWARGASVLPSRSAKRTSWMAWGLSAAAAALLIAGGVRAAHHAAPGALDDVSVSTASAQQGEAGTAVSARSSAVSDEALLEQIQGDLSAGVPAAMQPLATSDVRRSHASAAPQSE